MTYLRFGDPTANELADFLALQDDAKAYRLGSFASLLQILVILYLFLFYTPGHE